MSCRNSAARTVFLSGATAIVAWCLPSVLNGSELRPKAMEVRKASLSWLSRQKETPAAVSRRAAAIWDRIGQTPSSQQLHSKVIDTFAIARKDVKEFTTSCRLTAAPLIPPSLASVIGNSDDRFFVANMRLYFGRHLVHRQMYDEALRVLSDVDADVVADPVSRLFYKSVCQHQLMLRGDALRTLAVLLDHADDVPNRYLSLAGFMQSDLLRPDSGTLKSIANMMRDSKRRLSLARGGQRVQKVQGEIIAALDRLIDKHDPRPPGHPGPQPPGRTSGPPEQPADDSRILGRPDKGEVDKSESREDRKGWGNLPPAEISKIKNLINKKFPPHYRRAIEAFSKARARRAAKAR